eukprot:9111087-Pyramimonas_sp.AAC.1
MWPQSREGFVRTWTDECESHWGAAARGNSAVREVFLRAVDEELAGRLGVAHGHGLCDIAQFCDSVGWHRIAAAALRLDFPAEILGHELQQCMAVRCVRQSGAYGPPFCPTRSIVQGLRAGTRF